MQGSAPIRAHLRSCEWKVDRDRAYGGCSTVYGYDPCGPQVEASFAIEPMDIAMPVTEGYNLCLSLAIFAPDGTLIAGQIPDDSRRRYAWRKLSEDCYQLCAGKHVLVRVRRFDNAEWQFPQADRIFLSLQLQQVVSEVVHYLRENGLLGVRDCIDQQELPLDARVSADTVGDNTAYRELSRARISFESTGR